MIVFVQLSKRRYMALNASSKPTSWRSLDQGQKGFAFTDGAIIAGPGSWSEVTKAVTAYVQKHDLAMTHGDLFTENTALHEFDKGK